MIIDLILSLTLKDRKKKKFLKCGTLSLKKTERTLEKKNF